MKKTMKVASIMLAMILALCSVPVGAQTATYAAANAAASVPHSNLAAVNTSTLTPTTYTATATIVPTVGTYLNGDVNGDGVINSNDAVYLLRYTLLPSRFPVIGSADLNGDGVVNSNDAIHLLRHTLKPDDFPLVVNCLHENSVIDKAVSPTCTETGLTEGAHCAECDAWLVLQKSIDSLGHDYEDGVCSRCGESTSSKGLKFISNGDGTCYVGSIGDCIDTEITIHHTYDGMTVTGIGEKAFYDCDNIISIVLPDTITWIGDKAFADCEKLLHITMPDVFDIGVDVFRGSIKIQILIRHYLDYVTRQEASCTTPGHIAHYTCHACGLNYEDPQGHIRLYDVTIPSSHDFVDGVCRLCGAIQNSVKIVSVDTIPTMGKFPTGTLEAAIGLPKYVNVYTADSRAHQLAVEWDLSGYDKSRVGIYTIRGVIQREGYHFADGVSDQLSTTIEIVDVIEGTADIVFVIDISGSMSDEINNVKNNITTFAQKIEDQGVAARWGLVTYSDLTESGANEKSQIKYNGAAEWFVSAEDYRDAIGAISLANGGDAPETAIDGLILANTMTTRRDARVFYILLTDCNYKNNNNYGVSNMTEAAQILKDDGVNVSVITGTSYYSTYSELVNTTGGITANIDSNFNQTLYDSLIPIIYDEVIS